MVTLFTKYWRSLLVIVLLLLGGGGGLAYYIVTSQQQISAVNSQADLTLREARKIRADYDQRLKAEAEKRAKIDAEAKAATEAASRAAQTQTGLTLPTTSTSCNSSKTHNSPASIDILVNKKHCLIPLNFTPTLATHPSGAVISTTAMTDFSALMDAAAAASVPLSVTSSFRSYDNQVATYQHWVAVNGSQAAADKVSARPGFSEHQTGLAVDFSAGGCSLECFTGSAQRVWMMAHAAEYGWIERYPAGQEPVTGYSAESWHYRYVGSAVALDMKNRNIATLEDYWHLSGGDYQ